MADALSLPLLYNIYSKDFNFFLGYQSLVKKNKSGIVRDLFITPSFDELDAVAMDTKGEPRRLNTKHLESIQERG